MIRPLTCAITLLACALGMAACAAHKNVSSPSQAVASPSAAATPSESSNNAPSGPGASIAISYSHRGDYLLSFSVVKFAGARLLMTHKLGPDRLASIVILNGGVPVWQFSPDRGLLAHIGFDKEFAVHTVQYGELPKGFVEQTPPSGPPEPLEPGRYYVVSVTRSSGTSNYEAFKVREDGSLDAYAARPLAGSSYELCCNVSPDFALSTALQ
ncbi:MAG: hypothetical protein ACREP6_08560 [Candidatus Binataceae bacterium]